MIIFPIIYCVSFFLALRELWKGKAQGILLFIIFGLSIYTTALSLTFQYGFGNLIPFLQPLKEFLVVVTLIVGILQLKKKVKLQFVDYAVLCFFGYTLLYTILPIGSLSFLERLGAFKSLSFFTLVYFCGRFIDIKNVFLRKYFLYILVLSVLAAGVVILELVTYTHLQTYTGYSNYNYYFFNNESSGNYGLTWTFESAGGFKRFASFFANPLEHAAATIISLSVLAAYYTNDQYKIKFDKFGIIALIGTFLSIFLAVSRSSFASYFLVIYMYGVLTKKKYIPKIAHFLLITISIYFIYVLIKDLGDDNNVFQVVITTLNFTDASSAGHVLEWLQGINAIYLNPFGLGLGSSGQVAASLGDNVGGENQFIIIGVQTGLIGLGLYIALFISVIKQTTFWFYRLNGNEKKICLVLLLTKIGLLIPFLTSEVENSVYISYMLWFLTGIFINIISKKKLINEQD